MKKVGVTGGIGSGKSTICRIFNSLGIPVYYSDIKSKLLLQTDQELIQKVKDAFGRDIYDDYDNLNKKKLSDLVFKDDKALKLLNEISHPAVQKDFNEWCSYYSEKPYILKEAAILFESGVWKNLDIVVMVYAPEEMRIQRIMQRDGVERSKVLEIMSKQMPETEKMSRSDYVIFADEEHSLTAQVHTLHQELK